MKTQIYRPKNKILSEFQNDYPVTVQNMKAVRRKPTLTKNNYNENNNPMNKYNHISQSNNQLLTGENFWRRMGTQFENISYLGCSKIKDPVSENEMHQIMSTLNSEQQHSSVRIILTVPHYSTGIVHLIDSENSSEIMNFSIHRIRLCSRGHINSPEGECFALSYDNYNSGQYLYQCHVFRSNVPEGSAKILFSFANAFNNTPPNPLQGLSLPTTSSFEIITNNNSIYDDYEFESFLDIREEDGNNSFQSCPQEKNCFRLRRDRMKRVMIIIKQVKGPKLLKIKSSFGLLLAAGRNLKGSDMQLMDMLSLGPVPQNKCIYVIEGLWNPTTENFEVLNTETPRETRVFMTVAADVIFEGIGDSVRFYVECKARIYHQHERFCSVIRNPIFEKHFLKTSKIKNQAIEGMRSVSERNGTSIDENIPPVEDTTTTTQIDTTTIGRNNNLMKVINFESTTERDRALRRQAEGKIQQEMPTQLIHPADDDDSDHDEPLLSGSGHVNQECSEEVMKEWNIILEEWEKDLNNNPENLKILIKNGIPDILRGKVWQYITKVPLSPELSTSYYDLNDKQCPCDSVILRDIHRTFPAHEYFKEPDGPGQQALYKISKAYALYDEEVSYCQGLSFLAASLILHMDEDKAFSVLVKIMFDYSLRDLFKLGFDALQLRFYQLQRLLQDDLPNLHKFFNDIGIETHMYASQWFLTMFTAKFPLQMVFFIVDLFLCEGIDTIFHISFALLNDSESDLMQLDFDGVLTYFRVTLPRKYRTEESAKALIHQAVKMKVKNEKLKEYETEYNEIKQKEFESLNPEQRLEKENLKLHERVRRLDCENDDLARELVTSKIELCHKLDAAEDQIERYQSTIEKLTRQNRDLEDENKSLSDEFSMVKETCRREMDRLENECQKHKKISQDYKEICSKMDKQINKQKDDFKMLKKSISNKISNCDKCTFLLEEELLDSPRSSKKNSPTSEEVCGFKMIEMRDTIDEQDERIKQLELELAQTKLALVEAQCQNQDLTHQMSTSIINTSDNSSNKPAWLKKTIISFKEAKTSLKNQHSQEVKS
uniref:PID domain-containing protein n=1 Tax=Parastrongyloides trichosuri TaxID=131310 RepID=A0A0N4Z4K9_PARTI